MLRGYTQYLPTGKYTNSSFIIDHFKSAIIAFVFVNNSPYSIYLNISLVQYTLIYMQISTGGLHCIDTHNTEYIAIPYLADMTVVHVAILV